MAASLYRRVDGLVTCWLTACTPGSALDLVLVTSVGELYFLLGSNVRVETDRQADGRTEAIALPTVVGNQQFALCYMRQLDMIATAVQTMKRDYVAFDFKTRHSARI